MSFSTMCLSAPILRAIQHSGHTAPTSIQSAAIPAGLNGKNLIACAPTGTGKTAAFLLPILERLHREAPQKRRPGRPAALILTPTRELSEQILSVCGEYGRFTNARALCVIGGVSLSRQLRELSRNIDIVIATPGRLLDHLGRGSVDLSQVQTLVLDEADRMYDMGFIRDVRKIIALAPAKRQTLLFSATMAPEIRRLIHEIAPEHESIMIEGACAPVTSVVQRFYAAEPASKLPLLQRILKTETVERMLVFSRTRRGADRISRHLKKSGIRVEALHAGRTQQQRTKVLKSFRSGETGVLVATDIAARGIDVTGVSHVVNFNIPAFAEDYIHRIGRTGRASAPGTALSFVSCDEEKYLRKIGMQTGEKLHLERYPGTKESRPAVTPKPAPPLFGRNLRLTGSRVPRFA
ncbi:MAG: DEAD/DEAH box helicase [Chitinivibrionales bacterium]